MSGEKVKLLIESIDPKRTLLVRLPDTDETGVVPFSEIPEHRRHRLHALIHTQLCAVRLPCTTADRQPVFSIKDYETAEYLRIRDDFEQRVCNTYPADWVYTDPDGKFALYELAQGIVGALYPSNFSLAPITNFRGFVLPRRIHVSILSFKPEHRIDLSTIPAFGSFEENVRRLGLEHGAHAEGYAVDSLSDGRSVIMLAPNLTLIADAVPERARVSLSIQSVDANFRRIQPGLALSCDDDAPVASDFDCAPFVFTPCSAYINVDVFADANKPARITPVKPPQEFRCAVTDDMLADFDASPISVPFLAQEVTRHIENPQYSVTAYSRAVKSRHVGRQHHDLAQTVDMLRYTTAPQLAQFLQLTGNPHDLSYLEQMLETCWRYGILSRFVYTRPDESPADCDPMIVYTRGYRYKSVAQPQCFFMRPPMSGDSASFSKGRLAVNQLLLGCMYTYRHVACKPNLSFKAAQDERTYMSSCYCITVDELGVCYLESCRADYEDQLLEKLPRYEMRFAENQIERPNVLITFENKDAMMAFAQKARALNLHFCLRLTYDELCFQKKKFPVVLHPAGSKLPRLGHLLSRVLPSSSK